MEAKKYWDELSEGPLDKVLPNGGFCSIFRTLGVIGDSLSAGELESNPKYGHQFHDYYEYSWGKYLGRMSGVDVKVFARGGMSADAFAKAYGASLHCWDLPNLCQAYILALGVNDLLNQHQEPGGLEDICMEDYRKNAPTFTGYFASIMQRLRGMDPNVRFFLVTMPVDPGKSPEIRQLQERHAALMHQLAQVFPHTFVIDLRKHGPVHDEGFYKKFYSNWHLNPAGYYLTAQLIGTYIDHIIRSDFEEFSQVGFIGTPYYDGD